MKRPLLLAATLAAVCLAIDWHRPLQADVRGPHSLTALVAVNSLTRDTNGDGLPDTVAARVIVPAAPTLADVEAATNLAARLGYETTALSLPVVLRDGDVSQPASIGVPVLVGRENRFVKRLIDNHTIEVSALKPGQGLIAAVASPLGGGDGLASVGGHDEGTLNAGIELAARLPRVWGTNGITLPAVEEQTVRYLRGHGVNAAEAAITSMLVDSDKRGLARVAVRVDVADGDVQRAAKLFEDLELAHRRGQEPRTLDFTNVATTAIDIAAGEKVIAHATVSRTGLNQRTVTPPI